jgi:uncharacterized protein YfaQ (DUF2300 family)
MRFNRSGHRDDLLFVIALLLPAIFAGARYFQSDREMTQIAQARAHSALVADGGRSQEHLRVAYAQSHGR